MIGSINDGHQCQFSEHKIAKISEWSKSIIQSQDDERLNEILDKSRLNSKTKMEVIDKYYETAAKPLHFKVNNILNLAKYLFFL